MARVELVRPISVPPEHVFAFFVPQRMPYWYGAEMQSCFEVQDGANDFSVGLKVRISGRLGSQDVSLTSVITAFASARLLEWRFADSFGVRGLERWELERVPAARDASDGSMGDSTTLRFISQYEMPGRLGRLMDRLWTRRAVTQRNREYLERLARLAESR
jgi:uncharacterized protein YndB with AHSA1/START domain